MARSRMIRPEFFDDEKLSECSLSARLLFIALWVNSDDYGVVKGNPKWLKAQAFPYDDISLKSIENDLESLKKHNCIIPFVHNDEFYFFIRNWTKYQKVNRPSKVSRNPEPPQDIMSTHGGLTEDSLSTHGGLIDETETETETETELKRSPAPKNPAPSPPSKILCDDWLSEELDEQDEIPIQTPPAKKAKPHFEIKYDPDIGKSIVDLCNQLNAIPASGSKALNPFEWVQQKANKNGHPQAIIDTLRGGIPYLPQKSDWWGYLEKIFLTKNGNYNERDTRERSEQAKRELAELVKEDRFKKLLSGIGG